MRFGWFRKPIDDLTDIAKIQLPSNVPLNDTWVDDADFYITKRTPIISIKNGVIEGGVDLKKMLRMNNVYDVYVRLDGESTVVDFVRIVKNDLSYYMAIEVGVGKGEGEFHKIVPVSIKAPGSSSKPETQSQLDEKEQEMSVLKDLTLYELKILDDLHMDRDAIVKKLIKKYNLSEIPPPAMNDNTTRIPRNRAFCRGCRKISSLTNALDAVSLCVFNSKIYICVCTISSNGSYRNDSYDVYLYNRDGTPASDVKNKYTFQYVAATPSIEPGTGFNDYQFRELSGKDAWSVNGMKFYRIPTVTSSSGGKKKRQTVMDRKSKSKSRRRFIPSSSKKYRKVLKSHTRRRVRMNKR
jgi:hypothetical protein